MPKLLIIDDEPSIRLSIKAVFAREDVTVLGAETAEDGLRLDRRTVSGGDPARHQARAVAPDSMCFTNCGRLTREVLIIFITGFGTTDTAIEAMKLGAYDYLTKPLDAKQLKQVVEQALAISRLAHVPTIIDEGDRPEDRPDRLIGSGPAMQAVCKQIGRVAPQDVNVLILGESGTGKELVARALYHHSRRNQAPFLAINCAAIPESLLESELFGHERGAFTGADRRRIGKFEQCHGGTLFLDEVGDMAPHTQAKILRLIQEGRFERLGGSESISVDVRILAATNQDLDTLIGDGRFRKDLYYRLSGVTIPLPPLRDRPEDIPELAHYFLFRYNRATRDLRAVDFARSARVAAVVPLAGQRARTSERRSADPHRLGRPHHPAGVPAGGIARAGRLRAGTSLRRRRQSQRPIGRRCSKAAKLGSPLAKPIVYRRAREQFDRLVILGAMQQVAGNRNQAAKILGLSQVTLRSKLRSMAPPNASATASLTDDRRSQ